MNDELSFEQKLARYADLTVRVGLNIQPGQRLIIRSSGTTAEARPLLYALVASAYRAGARYVDVLWSDEQIDLLRLQHAPRDSFDELPAYTYDELARYAERGDAVLSLVAADPACLDGQDAAALATIQRVTAQTAHGYRRAMGLNRANWCVIAAAVPGWAARVFPTLPAAGRISALWEAIFSACRVDTADPLAAWRAQVAQLVARRSYMSARQYDALHLCAPGTDLTIGLPVGHIWHGGEVTTTTGIPFTPNLPTEEIFTLPHRARVDGTLRASLPLSLNGTLVADFGMTFADGRVVDLYAGQGEYALRKLVETDDGAARLGEVALVPNASPLAQMRRLFYNTLYDENAASHIALGRAYLMTLTGGEQMADDAFAAAGGNLSLVHTDFMIGSGAMDIDGITADGTREPVMRAGEWAFDV